MSLRSVLFRPLWVSLARLFGWIGDNPLRVAGVVAALWGAGSLYWTVEVAGDPGLSPATAVAARPAYALLVLVGLGAFSALR